MDFFEGSSCLPRLHQPELLPWCCWTQSAEASLPSSFLQGNSYLKSEISNKSIEATFRLDGNRKLSYPGLTRKCHHTSVVITCAQWPSMTISGNSMYFTLVTPAVFLFRLRTDRSVTLWGVCLSVPSQRRQLSDGLPDLDSCVSMAYWLHIIMR